MPNEKTTETKLCKHCQTAIPKKAKVCPNCRKKQGGIVKWIVIAVVVLGIISAAAGGGDKKTQQASSTGSDKKTQQTDSGQAANSNDNAKDNAETKEVEKESEAPKEYISVTADELSDALANNAMKAQNDYKGKYLTITGKLGNIDSNGKYIDVDTDKDFDLTMIQCYIKTDEQKQAIIEMSRGDAIVVKGYCKDVGELLGYSVDIEEISKQ